MYEGGMAAERQVRFMLLCLETHTHTHMYTPTRPHPHTHTHAYRARTEEQQTRQTNIHTEARRRADKGGEMPCCAARPRLHSCCKARAMISPVAAAVQGISSSCSCTRAFVNIFFFFRRRCRFDRTACGYISLVGGSREGWRLTGELEVTSALEFSGFLLVAVRTGVSVFVSSSSSSFFFFLIIFR